MKDVRVIELLALAIVFATTACSTRHNANQDLRDMLRSHDVNRIEILKIPDDVTMPVRVTSETIADKYHARLEIKASAVLPAIEELQQPLANTGCNRSSSSVDVRTAIVFFDAKGTKLRSFYYGSAGRNGQVDSTTCELGDGLLKWAYRRLPEV